MHNLGEQGEGVCTEREVVDEEEVEERNGFGIFQANMRVCAFRKILLFPISNYCLSETVCKYITSR